MKHFKKILMKLKKNMIITQNNVYIDSNRQTIFTKQINF